MKRLTILFLALSFLFPVSCNKPGVEEAWPGEKTLENTVWGHFPELSTQSDMYVIIWNYDAPVNLVVKNDEGKGVSCTGKVIFEDATHNVTISDIKPRTEGETAPEKMTGSVSASGLKMKWSCGDADYDCLFIYTCPADQLGTY